MFVQLSEWTGYSNFFLFKVVLDDIPKESPLIDYRYLGASSTSLPTSVMCSPILHLNTLLGIIPLPTISHVLSNRTHSIFDTFFLALTQYTLRVYLSGETGSGRSIQSRETLANIYDLFSDGNLTHQCISV